MPSRKQRKDCPKCTNAPRDTTPRHSLKELTAGQVEEFAARVERIGPDGFRHAMDPARLEGVYHLSNVVFCSYRENDHSDPGHPHGKGFVGWSRCDGLLLLVGWDCARNNIIDFKTFWDEVQVIQSIEKEQRIRDGDVADQLLARMDELVARYERRQVDLANLKRFVPPAHTAMRNAWLKKDFNVPFEFDEPIPGTDKTRKQWTSEKLSGMRLFDEGRRARITGDKVRGMQKHADEFAAAGSVKVRSHNVRSLRSTRTTIIRDIERLGGWLEETDEFFTEKNLALVAIKTYGSLDRVPNHVKFIGSAIVIEGTERVIIGLIGG